ncbi:discoidin domain-containing protein [Paenibacillus sacheonensis]|nr:discoidin domain-containing protein [Paenibacillus sacheonensis]
MMLFAALILAALAGAFALRSALFPSRAVHFEADDGLLRIGNDKYEIAFSDENGGITYVQDEASGKRLTAGNRQGALWWGILQDESSVSSVRNAPFSYSWNAKRAALALHYGGQLQVDVTASFDRTNRIVLEAAVVNGTKETIQSFRFPYELKFAADDVVDGMLPMLPGAKLKPAFFTEGNAYAGQYPGVMFASYTALRTKNGNLALYDIGGKPTATTQLGFKNQTDDAGKSAFVHDYSIWTMPGGKWQSPAVVLEVGGDYPDSIGSYRTLNGIDAYRSVDDKLDAEKAHAAGLPLYKLDIAALGRETWTSLESTIVDKLPYSGIVHLVGFQTGGHDENYPDFVPPAEQWGSMDDFKAFIEHAKTKGSQVVPYTNFSWWGVHSPTLAGLPDGVALADIVVQQQNGEMLKEDYGEHSGYVMNLNHPFVTSRIAKEHERLLEAGVDGIFEDQWGIRNAPFAANSGAPNTDPWSAYFEGVRNYFDSLNTRMYTEDGTDVLADDSIGFMGTNYLWDLLGYRKNTASYTDYYPLAGMLLRDKVLLYQHDLAAETMTDNKDMLRWNVAMGYNLSGDLYTGVNNPWIDVIGVFQKYVLADYADARVRSYDAIDATTTRTDFGTHTVIANWDTEKPYSLDEQTTLSAGGFEASAESGTVRAGSYIRYNGFDLDPGEHLLAEVRGKRDIRIYQPLGADTTLRVKTMAGWKHAAAAAYTADGSKIADIPVAEQGDWLQADYIASILGKRTAYIAFASADQASAVKDVPFKKTKSSVNAALKHEADSSTDANAELTADLAVDGDPFTYWESLGNRFPQSITVDLGRSQKVGRVVLKLPPMDAWESRDQSILIEGSDDGEQFKAIIPKQTYTFDPAKENTVEIRLGGLSSRYVRLVIDGNTAWPAAQVSELEVYGE